MVAPRDPDTRLDGLEKVVGDLEKKTETLATTVNNLKIQYLKIDEGVSALGSQLEKFRAEMRAGFTTLQLKSKPGPEDDGSSDNLESNSVVVGCKSQSPMPTFDGTEALAWLAQAEQYFLMSKIPLENRVSVAMEALAGPALPWIQLLMQRIPTLSWDRFTQEMMKRFGDSIAWKPKSVAVRHEIPAITTSEFHTDIDTKAINGVSLPLAVQQPIPPPVLVPLPSPPSLPTPATPLTPATPPTLAPVTAPLLSTSSHYILQFQPPFSSLLRCLVSAAHQSTPMAVSFPGSLFSLAGTPFYYLIMLRCFHIVGHLLWFNALATSRKHEFEPPPNKVICFNFELSLEGKAVSRVRQLTEQDVIWLICISQDMHT